MEEDDDDFYGSGEAHQDSISHIKHENDGESKPDKMDMSADEGEESEDDDSDDVCLTSPFSMLSLDIYTNHTEYRTSK